MKVNFENDIPGSKFGDLGIGECFSMVGLRGQVFVKVEDVYTETDEPKNAFCLNDSRLLEFSCYDTVQRVSVEINAKFA